MSGNKADDIEKLRHSFRPDKIAVLFVGESPPAGGKFFYKGNGSAYIEMKKAFHAGEDFLSEFKTNGYFFDDLVLKPINKGLKTSERRRFHKNAASSLAERLAVYSPLAVVSLLKAIEPSVTDAMMRSGISKVPHYSVSFPGNGQQRRFQQEITEILPLLPCNIP